MYIGRFVYPNPKGSVTRGFYRKPRVDKFNEKTTIKLNGFDKVFAPGVSRVRKIAWFFIVIILSLFSGYQVFNCIHNFIHQSIAVTVDYVKNTSITPPCIIICPLILTRNVKLISHFWKDPNKTEISAEDLYNLIGSTTTVEELWEISDMIDQELSLQLIEGLSLVDNWIIDNSALKQSKVYGLSGKCTIIHAKRNIVYNGLYTFIRIRNIAELPYGDGTFLQISVQPETMNHIDKLFVAKDGIIIPLHAQVSLYYTLQELVHLNTKKQPCTNSKIISKCLDDCIERVIQQDKIKCRLPSIDIHEEFELPVCSTLDEFRNSYESADRLMRSYSLEFCNCPRKCHSTLYNLKSVSELHVDEDIALNLNIFFSDNSVQRITEYDSYKYSSLLSDIGGTLGLYLGICLISIIEIIEVIGLKVFWILKCK